MEKEELWTLIWKDINNGGKSFYIFLVLILGIGIYRKIEVLLAFLNSMYNTYTTNKYKNKKYKSRTVESLQNHPIFEALKFRKDNPPPCSIPSADRGKVRIATDLLKIYYQVAYTKFIAWKTEDFNEWTTEVIKNKVTTIIIDIHSALWSACKEEGIPDAFLKKFSGIIEPNQTHLTENILQIVQTDLPISLLEKIYIILNLFQAYTDTIIANVPKTVLSINGDLKGLTYKNIVIGSGEGATRKYFPPDVTFPDKVHPFLTDLIHRCRASRCRVVYFHDYDEKLLEGMFSIVYEASCPGVTNSDCSIAYKYCSYIDNIILDLLKNKFGVFEIEECKRDFQYLVRDDGIQCFVACPIYIVNKMIGFISVEWLSANKEDIKNNLKLKNYLRETADKVSNYLIYQ